jgi:hypothetical protein
MKRSLPLLLAATLAFGLALAQLALAQEDIKTLAPAAFKSRQRPPAVFVHDKHNEKAQIAECVVCHHGGKGGKIDKSASTEGTPCSECHQVAPKDKTTGLMKAYHKQCIECHRAKGKGPVACGQCHKR